MTWKCRSKFVSILHVMFVATISWFELASCHSVVGFDDWCIFLSRYDVKVSFQICLDSSPDMTWKCRSKFVSILFQIWRESVVPNLSRFFYWWCCKKVKQLTAQALNTMIPWIRTLKLIKHWHYRFKQDKQQSGQT